MHVDDSTHAAGSVRIMGRHQQRGAFADGFVKAVSSSHDSAVASGKSCSIVDAIWRATFTSSLRAQTRSADAPRSSPVSDARKPQLTKIESRAAKPTRPRTESVQLPTPSSSRTSLGRVESKVNETSPHIDRRAASAPKSWACVHPCPRQSRTLRTASTGDLINAGLALKRFPDKLALGP